MAAAPSSPSLQSHRVLTNTDGEALHHRITTLAERFAEHDAKNAERFGRLDAQVRHIEKTQDRQGEKIESIETTVNRMDGKLDQALRVTRTGDSDSLTKVRQRAEVESTIWTEKAKKAALWVLVAGASALASIFGYKAVSAGPDHSQPTPAPTEAKP